MSGNVWEWCEDTYEKDFYKNSPDIDPVNRKAGENRVLRGGGWGDEDWGCRAAYRLSYPASHRDFTYGFRVVLAPPRGPATPQETNAALKASNPKYNGKGTFRFEAGRMVEAHLANTGVSDLSPLQGAPLQKLDLRFCREVSDLTPLTGAPLTSLIIQGADVTDLGPLKGMPLQSLDITECKKLTDISAIKGAPITRLNLHSCPALESIDALAGMKLDAVNIEGCARITDISPLKGMPLEYLKISGTQVGDLTPVKGMPLKHVHLEDSKVTDVTPLAESPIEKLIFDPKNIAKGIEAIRNLKTIREIGPDWDERTAPADFWKKYDAGGFK